MINSAAINKMRLEANSMLNPERKVELGQFMTSPIIAEYMASLFNASSKPAHLLDAGAGIGSLTIAAAKSIDQLTSISAWEVDPIMVSYLRSNLVSIGLHYNLHELDFITDSVFQIQSNNKEQFTHAILNPPYKKISTDSIHRRLLKSIGIETVNLYTAFLALAILLVKNGGEIVAIIPRSFCNGPYYKPFRKFLLDTCSIDHIHVFDSRNKAFKDDAVLQENIIIKLTKAKKQGDLTLSSSNDASFSDYSAQTMCFDKVIHHNDDELFIHLPTRAKHSDVFDLSYKLEELTLEVRTGPVVDFRLKEYWQETLTNQSVQLIYPHHFLQSKFEYPKAHKKPNALILCEETKKWLMPRGYYVLVKRFSSKEEKKRLVAFIISPDDITSELIGFENHWNVFHNKKAGLEKNVAMGLACFLNSTYLDEHFRIFSGHTQVNATDLRNMKYPSMQKLLMLGEQYKVDMSQIVIDQLVRSILS